MKRIIKVLVVSALLVVLMATTVSPASAKPVHDWKPYGYGADGENDGYGQDGENDWKQEDGPKGFKAGQTDDKHGWGA